jgi:hypothetical protein
MRKCMLAAVAVVVSLVGPVARADGPEHDRAVASFDEARKLIDAGDCEHAIPKLRESLAYEPSVGARLSMADCYEAHEPLEAWINLREAERLAYLKNDDRRLVARDRATALESRVAVVHVVIPAALLPEEGLEVRVDGALVDRYYYGSGVLAMKPGPHVVEASTPNRKWSQTVVAQQGAPSSVTVQLQDKCPAAASGPVAPAPAPAVVEAPRDAAGSAQRSVAWVLGGVGLAGLAAGAAFGLVALEKQSDITNACGGNVGACTATPGSLDAENGSRHEAAIVSAAGLVVGGVALAGAVALYLTAPSASPAEGRVGLAAGAGRDGASVLLTGRW